MPTFTPRLSYSPSTDFSPAKTIIGCLALVAGVVIVIVVTIATKVLDLLAEPLRTLTRVKRGGSLLLQLFISVIVLIRLTYATARRYILVRIGCGTVWSIY